MTIRMLQAWDGYPQQAVVSMSASERFSSPPAPAGFFISESPAC